MYQIEKMIMKKANNFVLRVDCIINIGKKYKQSVSYDYDYFDDDGDMQ